MSSVRVQFLAFDGCPLAEAAKTSLEQALADCGIEEYEAIDLLDPDMPEALRGWGSPTILVNGTDVVGDTKGDSVGCRVYASPEGVPSAATIARRIRDARQAR